MVGAVLLRTRKQIPINIISLGGTIYKAEQLSVVYRLRGLSKSNMSMLLRRKKSSYKG